MATATPTKDDVSVPLIAIEDLISSYSADLILDKGKIRKPAEIDGRKFVCTGLTSSGAAGCDSIRFYEVVPPSQYGKKPASHETARAQANKRRGRSDGFYHGIAVKQGRNDYVILGPERTCDGHGFGAINGEAAGEVKPYDPAETFDLWRARVAQGLDWKDTEFRGRNDELLELYHDNVRSEDAVSHLTASSIPETPSQAAAKEAAVDHETEPLFLLPMSAIAAAPWNPRRVFASDSLKDLADSIKRHGVLQPVVVIPHPEWTTAKGEPRYQLILGERRWRAAKLAKLQTIPARIRDITEEEAKEACIEENLRREDLNPIEKARTVQLLMEGCGLTQAATAKRLGYANPSQVANELFLLELPEAWQARIVSQEISPTHTRHLRTWLDRSPVVARIGERLDRHLKGNGYFDGRPPTVKEFEELVLDAARDCSRPLQKPVGSWDRSACQFRLTPKRREELDVVKVPQKFGAAENRAFNIDRWNELQKDAKAKKKQQAADSNGSTAKTSGKPSSTKSRPESQAPNGYSIRLGKQAWYRRRIAWVLEEGEHEDLLRMVLLIGGSEAWYDGTMSIDLWRTVAGKPKLHVLGDAVRWEAIADKSEAVLWDALRALILEVLRGVGCDADVDLETLRRVALSLGIDFAAEWMPTADEFEGASDAWLRKLPQAKDAPETLQGDDLAKWLADNWEPGSKIPKEFQEPKAEGRLRSTDAVAVHRKGCDRVVP